ncbi:thioredoxin family protein [Egibacter rhizosphaerae]|uniref:Thioredoxin family protein n=1 Tax=Egibacter rhizosphaerae TaxID=1670831 RepID=A0A411YLR6_9ACTN|nr:thioredoxin family protein [Egibacter rhizosphaerae]
MVEFGMRAPAFSLLDTEGHEVSLDDFADAPAMLVMFICNHCPFVKHVQHELARLAEEYQQRGVGVVGINANDPETHPSDSPEEMRAEASRVGYTFPYLFDERQDIAKAYGAVCTPDFFLFDGDRRLVYRGQTDASRPGNDVPVTGEDLRVALDRVLAGEPPPAEQHPSVGCSIKWKPGNEPA